ncbi:hypothetical protein AB0K18_19350 [Nonomuraea sp. NPDC049421]|uniref:hypothetical protein n=1 Tax=Nonomuraea sp. NPDC049421 TaxID=3155275 RepID=UPI0034365B2B
MLRWLAEAALRLYPKAWRERYGDEVGDLVAARPVRPRTVADLLAGAADAWLHHRRIPGAGPLRVPLAVSLVTGGFLLWFLWRPGLGDLSGVWARAAAAGPIAGQLRGTATSLFVAAGVTALLSLWQLGSAVRVHSFHDQAARTTARRMLRTAGLLAVPVALVVVLLLGQSLGQSLGPLGTAITGGFFVPILMALVLPLPLIASAVPAFGPAVLAAGRSLAVAALMNGLAWLAVAVLLVLGQASPAFVTPVAAGALIGVSMTALVAGRTLARGRAGAVDMPSLSGTTV